MPPKSKKNAPPSTPRSGTHKSRSKPQLPLEFNSNNELTSTDDSPAMKELRQTLGTLTTALAMMSSRMNQIKASSSCQPSLGPGLGAPLLLVPPPTWAWSKTSRIESSTE